MLKLLNKIIYIYIKNVTTLFFFFNQFLFFLRNKLFALTVPDPEIRKFSFPSPRIEIGQIT